MPPLPTSRKSFTKEELGPCTLYLGDCLDVLPTLPLGSADAVVTDPPYGLVEPRAVDGFGTMQRRGGVRTDDEKVRRRGGFMGKKWDAEVPGIPFWSAVAHALKPGGYLLAMGGTRTYHRLACAVEDAGFEVRDCLMWVYGTGFPKGKGCLKPAYEPILLCRKPGPKVLPLGIDECRTPHQSEADRNAATPQGRTTAKSGALAGKTQHDGERSEFDRPDTSLGRWPANLAHDGSDEVLEAFAAFGESRGKASPRNTDPAGKQGGVYGLSEYAGRYKSGEHYGDTGTAARFFYCAKASKSERGEGNTHPTVKPLALMEWLVRLVCPEGGTVLDPFCGSGSTAVACLRAGRKCVGIEREPAYFDIARRRISESLKERA